MHFFTTATSTDEFGRDATVAVLPVGSFEQHGDHLPLATDTLVASLIAGRIAAEYRLFLLPPITISCSHEHAGFPGTVSISARTVMSIIDDIRASLAKSGIERLVIVSGHGGNYVLSNVVQEANVDGPRVTLFPGRHEWDTARAEAGLLTDNTEDMHGGEAETSILLHAHPELVRSTYKTSDHDATSRPHLLVVGMRGYTASGIIGRASAATATKGRKLLDSMTNLFAEHLRILESANPPGPPARESLFPVDCDPTEGEIFGVRLGGS